MLEKAFIFLKHHWKIPAIVLLLLICTFLYRSKVASLLDILQKSRGEYKDALSATQKNSEESIRSVSEAALKEIDKQEKIGKEMQKEVEALEKEKDALEEELQEDLDELARKIKERF